MKHLKRLIVALPLALLATASHAVSIAPHVAVMTHIFTLARPPMVAAHPVTVEAPASSAHPVVTESPPAKTPVPTTWVPHAITPSCDKHDGQDC